MKFCFFLLVLFYPILIFSQQVSSGSYKDWDFVRKKENRTWSLDGEFILPVGKAAHSVNTNTAAYGYFFNYASKQQTPVHFTYGFGIRISRKRISARTFNEKLAYGKIINPLFIDLIEFDLKGSNPRIHSFSPKPFARFGPEAGMFMTYKLNARAEIQVSLLTALFGETVNGRINFAGSFQYNGNTITRTDYSFSGIGTMLNEGINLRFKKMALGIENYSTISYGNYFFRNYHGGTYDLNAVFKTEQIRFILSYIF